MLPKANRFTFKSKLPKQTLSYQSFSIKYGINDEGLKVAVVVSKKVDKRAVVRNKIKRVIIESVTQNLGKDANWTLIFYAKPGVKIENLAEEVSWALNNLKQNA
jgi:ribonuclease P protein component